LRLKIKGIRYNSMIFNDNSMILPEQVTVLDGIVAVPFHKHLEGEWKSGREKERGRERELLVIRVSGSVFDSPSSPLYSWWTYRASPR
jgi:hypothetical protein